ncbi:hypothetical protein Gotri_010837 [Gossypium trilobum]|uniref:Uncharacterized protein n=1 Tax=Gossypium trilobum TaxID=34281 RepID=A0A7J9ERR6_9ROSI|nr:hypothetical protein [Gossypium trilobum]
MAFLVKINYQVIQLIYILIEILKSTQNFSRK